MGNCTNQRKLKAGSKNIYFTEPEDTPQFKNRVLPLLELKVLLAKVKVVNPPQVCVTLWRTTLGSVSLWPTKRKLFYPPKTLMK